MTSTREDAFADAPRALLAQYGVAAEERRLWLSDPRLSVHVLEAGAGEPVLSLHGSGMSTATWIPLLAHLRDRRAGMRLPGWRQAMWSHLKLALLAGRQRPENAFADDELRRLAVPCC